MAIRFTCPCGREIQAKDEYAGTEGRCPSCGEVVRIPSLAEAPQPRQDAEPARPFPRPASPRPWAPADGDVPYTRRAPPVEVRLCTPGQVLLAAIIGTPIAGCLLIAWNFAAAG